MEIKVLGTGCKKCRKLYDVAAEALAASGVEARLDKVEKLDEIMTYGVMMTPALVIDGEVRATGRIPKTEEIVAWIADAAKASGA